MGRVTGAWERPIQGVSQQSDKDRIDGQCTLQENLIPSALDGLIKRTGTRFVKFLGQQVSDKSLWYSYNRGDDESYIILVEPFSEPRVFDINGNERTVNIVGGFQPYYYTDNPKEKLRMSTIADFTFLMNTEEVVGTLPDKSHVNPATAIVYCQFVTYGRDYIVKLDGNIAAKYVAPDGSEAIHANDIKTNKVAEELAEQINNQSIITESANIVETSQPPNGVLEYTLQLSNTIVSILQSYNNTKGISIPHESFVANTIKYDTQYVDDGDLVTVDYLVQATSDYQATVNGNTLFITKLNGSSFSIDTVDGSDGNDLVAIQDRVKQTSNLPPYAPEGYVIRVQSTEGFDENAYWLKAETDTTGTDQTGSGVRWVETVAQDTIYKFNKDTMPHVLISEADGSFTLDYGDWQDRRVGNEDTNPFPSFVGSRLSSIGIFQNRLMVTSGESAVFTRTSRFFDFFRETTQIASASDPVDGFADAEEINNLLHYATLDGDVVFFAENGQFLIDGSKPLSKEGLVFKKITSYPMNTKAKPAVTGESIMFSYLSGDYAGVREMFTDSFTDTKRARPITEHVSEYIEGVPIDIIASQNINTVFIRTDRNSDTLYVYDWLWSGDNKVQAAMHKWKFDGSVLYAKFIQDKVYFIMDRGYGIFLEVMPISSDADDSGLDFPIRLDQRDALIASYNGERWELVLNYQPDDDDKLVMVRGDGCWEADKGTSVIFERDPEFTNKYFTYDDLADTSVTQECTLTVGTTFTSKFIPTRPYLKDQNGRALGLDRFTLGKVTVNYESIGDTLFKVSDIRSRREWQYRYNGRMMGGWNNRVGFSPIDSGSFTFPVRLEAAYAEIEFSTDDYRPFIIRDMEWEGMYKQRGRRL